MLASCRDYIYIYIYIYTKDSYYLYNQEWFDHDEENANDLAKDWMMLDSPICLVCTTAKMLQCSLLVILKSIASLLHDVQRDPFGRHFKVYYCFTMRK